MKLKRTVALALALVLLLGSFPARTLAADDTPTETTIQETTVPETTVPETTGEAACHCEAAGDIHGEGCPLYVVPATEETVPQETTFEIPVWEEEETASQLTPDELYDALMIAPTLRETFILCNDNVDSLWGLNEFQVFELEDHVEQLYQSYEEPTQDETEAYEQLLDNVLTLKIELGVAECICDIPYQHDVDCPLFVGKASLEQLDRRITYSGDGEATAEGSIGKIHSSKTVLTDDSGNMAIQIEAWTEGEVSADVTQIVMVVDQSGSMHQAADANQVMSFEDLKNLPEEEKLRSAQHHGYYMVVAQNSYYKSGAKWSNATSSDRKKYLDRNYKFDQGVKWVTAMVRYDPETGDWYRSDHVSISEDQYNSLYVPLNFRDFDNIIWHKIEENSVWTSNGSTTLKAKYFKSVYGASMDGYYALLEELQNVPNCSVALVGFSSPASFGTGWYGKVPGESGFKGQSTYSYGGTGVFINGEFRPVTNKLPGGTQTYGTQLEESDYAKAFVSINSQEGMNTLTRAIQNIRTNYGETCTEDGFKLANKLFASNPVTNSEGDVKRVVILFTDGAPTFASGASFDNKFSPPSGTALNNVRNATLAEAYKTKNPKTADSEAKNQERYNAKVYTYGHSSIVANDAKLLMYQSSTYPTAWAEGNDAIGTPAEANPNPMSHLYGGLVSDSDSLEKTFGALGQWIFQESNMLDDKSELRDIVTPYFSIGGNYNGGQVTVDEIPFRTLDEEGSMDFVEEEKRLIYSYQFVDPIEEPLQAEAPDADAPAALAEDDPLDDDVYVTEDTSGNMTEDITIRLKVEWNVKYTMEVPGAATPQERTGDRVTVSGYNYGKNSVNTLRGNGAKLRLTIPIKPADCFLGGNHIPTNGPDSGLYPAGTNKPVENFDVPIVDLDVLSDKMLDSDVEARAGALYLGKVGYEKILDHIFVNISGTALQLNPSKDNYGLADWITDYSMVEVAIYDSTLDADGKLVASDRLLQPGDSVSVDPEHTVFVMVYIWPKYQKGSDTIQETRPADLEPLVGKVHFTMYYPTIVFSDTELYYGQSLSEVTDLWKGMKDVTQNVLWFSMEEYKELSNPTATDDPAGYDIEAMRAMQTIGVNAGVEDYVDAEVPEIFLTADPIDSRVPAAQKGDTPADSHFYEKYGDFMGKEKIGLNAQVYFANVEDPDELPSQPDLEKGMRSSFFLHVVCGEETCTHPGCQIAKHTSGSLGTEEYWQEEFYILPKTCQMTIHKTGGVPGETYIFHIRTNSPAAGSLNGRLLDYMSVSVTVDDQRTGQITITGLPVGSYTVEEDTAWTWRVKGQTIGRKWGYYDDGEIPAASLAANTAERIELLPEEGKDNVVVAFENPNPVTNWLSGFSAVVRNIFGIAH